MVTLARFAPARAGGWSYAALALTVAGLLAATWLILATDSDPGGVLWWLVLAPLAISLAPVVAPRHGVRVAAVVLLAVWCVVTGFTIGYLLLPALAAQIVAAARENR